MSAPSASYTGEAVLAGDQLSQSARYEADTSQPGGVQ